MTLESNDEKLDILSWQKVRMLSAKLHPAMLQKPEGYVARLNCHLKCDNTRAAPAKVRLVRFDKDYVAYKIVCLIQPLMFDSSGVISKASLQELLTHVTNTVIELYNSCDED